MTNMELLESAISDSGMKMNAVAEKAGIARSTLYNRMNGIGEFTATEIVGLSKALHMTDAERDVIFLSSGLNTVQH